jgi:alkylation response protein AidB-like acyl-CoA dehydrogenase
VTAVQEAPADHDEFVARAAEWLAEHAAPRTDGAMRVFTTEEAKEFQAALYDAGLAGIAYPRHYGGQGLSPLEARAFEQLTQRYEMPMLHFSIGLGMCLPTLFDLGTEEQKLAHMARMFRGEEIWCQMFSEPGAGSDVAGLQTTAVPVEGGWKINGQKVWTSGAQYCDYGLIVVRTDPSVPKHDGLSMFILDLRTPGVDIRPIKQATGGSHFNEIFLDDVFIPAENLIDTVGAGWNAAVTMLRHERVSVGSWDWDKSKSLSWQSLVDRARAAGRGSDAGIRRRLAELYTVEKFSDLLNQLHKEEAAAGRPPGNRGSVAKLTTTGTMDAAVQFAFEVGGTELLLGGPDAVRDASLLVDVIHTRSSGIAGGSNEIQHNIIGERVLGLPPEPRVDKGIPFSQITVGTQRRDG